MSNKNHNTILKQDINTPLNVIANSSRFNITASRFNNIEIGGNPIVTSISKLLTVMGEQDNTIKTLSKILGYDHNDRQMHDMHNSLFGGISGGFVTGSEDIDYGSLLTQVTVFVHQQNQQIQTLITAASMNDETNIANRI
ncbi:MAG TPA: hypothetical protein VN704_12625 [Verrucomicrobiae bacterium]|nr:hypothetical protein [Verrucomicrobiae bacterium]